MSRYIYHALPATVLGCLALCFHASPVAAQVPGRAADRLTLSLTKADVTDRDDEEKRLLKERYNAALNEWDSLVSVVEIGQLTHGDPELHACMQRVVSAGLQLFDRKEDRIKLLEEYVKVAKAAEEATAATARAGRASAQERHRTRYDRLDAELQLLREKKRAN